MHEYDGNYNSAWEALSENEKKLLESMDISHSKLSEVAQELANNTEAIR
jgi:hypothetical protein